MLTCPPRMPAAKRPETKPAKAPIPLAMAGFVPFPTPNPGPSITDIQINTYTRHSFHSRLPAITSFIESSSPLVPISRSPAWLSILDTALGHEPYAIEATSDGHTVGFLPLAFLDTFLFGKFLVSLPYLNTNGVIAINSTVRHELISRAVALADELNVRHLELRHEAATDHPELNARLDSKVHMRLPLPGAAAKLWDGFDAKVRNQVRKGEKQGFEVVWSGLELLTPFYDVLSRNMRALGSPLYGIALFREIVSTFPGSAEFCVVNDGSRPVAAALLMHGRGVTEVPSASSLKEYNPTNVNMLMYWHLLQRAISRGQSVFDFGRSTAEGSTYKFKKQWGSRAEPAVWQYRVNRGEVADMRPDNPRYRLAIRLWQRLPLSVTKTLGPRIVRGIP